MVDKSATAFRNITGIVTKTTMRSRYEKLHAFSERFAPQIPQVLTILSIAAAYLMVLHLSVPCL